VSGQIAVKSERGRGARFFFTARFGQTDIPEDRSASTPGKRILIVDDNTLNGRVLCDEISRMLANCEHVASGAEGLQALRSRDRMEPFDVVLLDFSMPGMDGVATATAIRADPMIAATKVVLMGSRAQRSEFQASGGLVDGWLTKPVIASRLLECLLERSPASQPESRDTPKRRDHSESDQPKLSAGRILVVDDNRINQRIALWQLDQLGYDADIASNGREAVEAFDRRNYSLILMDCQMPEMDGYEATAAIRRREVSDHRVAIVALTAHALEEERRNCLAKGMDDCLTKPVRLEDLARVVEHWLTHPD
jgi:two-component system sensor histidine kinase/response regulator